jgi:3D-(3,5/4)-trihydroxycyclohexane-1,2-dione acylhydrolase (decyclizing)
VDRSDGYALLLGGCGVSGTPAAGKVVGEADLVICVGTRLSDFLTGSQSAFHWPEVKFISVNVCGRDACKQGALPIVADAREALKALLKAGRGAGIRPDPDYLREVAEAKGWWERQLREEVHRQVDGEAMSQGQVIGVLNEEAQAGDVVIAAAGSPPGDLLKLWDASGGRACHIEFGYSCMGYELPAGLGVRMAQRMDHPLQRIENPSRPEGEVYVYIGDGTYLMNPTELVTAMQERLKVTVVVVENHGFQCIWNLQMGRAGRAFGNEFRARDAGTNRLEGEYLQIDFARNAESMGARAWRAATPDELRGALREAREEARSCVIVAEVEKHRFTPGSGVWWDVAPAEVSQDPATQEARAAYEEDRRRLQRFYY